MSANYQPAILSRESLTPLRMREARPWDVVKFPQGGAVQHDFAKWFEDSFPGVNFSLYDGAVRKTSEPLPDGSFWEWKYASVGTWDESDRVKNFRLDAGHHLLYREHPYTGGAWEFRTEPGHMLRANYQEER